MPDAARAVETARDLGWDADEWTETTEALAELVIGVFAFGSIIEENFVPSWIPTTHRVRQRPKRRSNSWGGLPTSPARRPRAG